MKVAGGMSIPFTERLISVIPDWEKLCFREMIGIITGM